MLIRVVDVEKKTADRPYGSPAVYYSAGNTTHFMPA